MRLLSLDVAFKLCLRINCVKNETISDKFENIGECTIQEGACAVDFCIKNGEKWPTRASIRP